MAENDKSLMKSPSTAIQVASVESKNEVLVVKPSGSADPIYQEGQILMKYKHYADALFCFEQVVDGLAKALRWVGQFEEAIQAFKQAIVLNVKDYWPHREYRELAKAYHYWGKQKFEQGYYEQAIECYRDAIVADSNYVVAKNDLTFYRKSNILIANPKKASKTYEELEAYKLKITVF